MKAIEVVNAVKGHKGQHVKAVWQRMCKTLKSCDFVIAKRTAAYVRTGIDYANMAVNADKETGPLPWGEWAPGLRNYVITHKGTEYVRLYPASFDNLKAITEAEYTLNGVPATYAEVEPYLLSSEKRKEDKEVLCFTVKAESIIAIA